MNAVRAWWRRFWDTPIGPFTLRCTDCGEEFITDDHDMAVAFQETHPGRCPRGAAMHAALAVLVPAAAVSLQCGACGVTGTTDSAGNFTHLCDSGTARITFTVVKPSGINTRSIP